MHIVLIEDHVFYRDKVEEILMREVAGIATVRTGGSVSEAVELVNSDHPLDLVITDTQIKEGNSIDVLCQVNRFDYDVIVMSSMDAKEFRIKCLTSAGFSFYWKYDNAKKLLALIDEEQILENRKCTAEKIGRLKELIAERQRRQLKPDEVKFKKSWFETIKNFVSRRT